MSNSSAAREMPRFFHSAEPGTAATPAPKGKGSDDNATRSAPRAMQHGALSPRAPQSSDLVSGMNHLCNHYVVLTGPDTASGRAYLLYVVTTVEADEQPIVWFGLYDEEYRKVEGHWLISKCSLQFLWPQKMTMPSFANPYPAVR